MIKEGTWFKAIETVLFYCAIIPISYLVMVAICILPSWWFAEE